MIADRKRPQGLSAGAPDDQQAIVHVVSLDGTGMAKITAANACNDAPSRVRE